MNKKHPAREGLFRRLQSGRREPLVHVQRGFGPPCPTNKLVAFDTWRGATGFFSKAFCLFRQTLIWWGGLDSVTPPAMGDEVARTLSHSRHIVAGGYGHIVSPHACAPRLIEKFVEEAGFATLPSSCTGYFAASARPPLYSSVLEAR